MRSVLILMGRYLPGFRDGGPVRSILNLTQWLGDEYDIRIMCLDRDHGDTDRYPGIQTGKYTTVGKAKVWYTEVFSCDDIERLANDTDVVYCCGPYNDYARIVMRLKKAGRIAPPLYVASMGSFSPEAFRIKGFKKKLFISYMRLAGMFDNVIWSVTTHREEEELKAVVGGEAKCVIAEDMPRQSTTEHTHIKETDSLRLCFLSRISRKKNLSFIPTILKQTDDDVKIKIDIYGVAEDKTYLRECLQGFDELKKTHPGCKWEYKGEADSEKVPQILAEYDAFILPTLGENYGHVIAESLSAGCIPIISDTTPWLDLNEKDCGYVCPSGNATAFAKAVEELYRMGAQDIKRKQDSCYEYIREVNERNVRDSGYRAIFG